MRVRNVELPTEALPLWRRQGDRILARVIEALVLLLVCLAPWLPPFAGTTWRVYLHGGLALVLALWGGRFLLQGRIVWRKCPVTLCLVFWFLGAILQLMPFPPRLLTMLAPGTADFYEHALPAEQEILPDNSRAVVQPRLTLSLDAQATRATAMELLAIFLLFAAVRNNLDPVSGLRRLSLAVTVNGALLGLVILVQFFLPGSFQAFGDWFAPETTAVPFLYLDMGIGLALGSLLVGKVFNRTKDRPVENLPPIFSWALVQPAAGLALMIGGLAFGSSTGDLVAVGLAAILSWLFLLYATGRLRLLGLGSFAALAVLAGWMWGDSFAPVRSSWGRVLAQAQDFPLWGTGLGTFAQVSLNRGFESQTAPLSSIGTPSSAQVLIVEAGAFGLILTLIVLGLVFRRGYLAFRLEPAEEQRGLAFGALFSLATLVIHGFFAWQSYVPAVALLATVLCAHLAGLPQYSKQKAQGPQASATFTIRLMGQAAPAGMAVMLLLSLVLVIHGRRSDLLQEFAQTATQLKGANDIDSRQHRLLTLQAAVQRAPGDSRFRLDLAQAHVQLLDKKLDNIQKETSFLETALISHALATCGRIDVDNTAVNGVLAWWLPMHWRNIEDDKKGVLENLHLLAAARQRLEARNASPLNPEAQLRIAGSVPEMKKADPPKVYRERAKWIAPDDPWVFYQTGLQEAEDGELQKALASWRTSLELSDGYLTQILDRCRDDLTAEEILQRILANRPQQLMSAALYLLPDPYTARKLRQPFLDKTLDLLQKQPRWSARDHYLAATAYSTLGNYSKALADFEKALLMEPRNLTWRYDFARFLYQYDNFQEAEKQLLTILERQPGHKRANDLLVKIKDRLAN